MSSRLSNIFSSDDINYLLSLPEVVTAKAKVDTQSNIVYFNISLSDTIRNALHERLGLDMTNVSTIPMRWIKGDTAPHIDSGSTAFENTYLVYLNDSPGELLVDTTSYPIEANTAFVFNEGLSHRTLNTNNVPRLLVGPMNEFVQPVGGLLAIMYYDNHDDALAHNSNSIARQDIRWDLGNTANFIEGSIGTYTSWRIAYVYGDSIPVPPTGIYNNGFDLSTLITDGAYYSYYVYPASNALCVTKGTRVLTPSGYVAVEELEKFGHITTADGRNVMIKHIHHSRHYNVGTLDAPFHVPAHAFAENIPSHDVKLSPDHLIHVGEDYWITPRQLSKQSDKVVQYAIGEDIEYYAIMTPNYFVDNLVIEDGVVVEAYGPRNIIYSEVMTAYRRRSQDNE